jgi:hypothetical protein
MTHTGSCHCGRIRFEVDGEVDSGMECNCSMCSRRGSLLWFVPREQLRLLTPEADAGTYLFNRHVIRHRFCPDCGIHAFGEGEAPGGAKMAAINLRTLEDFDLASVPVKHFDGRSKN